MRQGLFVLALVACPVTLAAQGTAAATADTAAPAPKLAHAVRIAGASPRLDGRLDDAAWQQARFFSDFVQKEPVEGAVPSESTLVGVLYDDAAIYIGARMYKRDPAAIQRNVSRRDVGAGQSEHIWFSFDSYHDRRTAWSFGVTAAGVRMDWYHPTDNEYNLDFSFDPVWQAKARVDSLGWTAELRIPLSQLRFRREDVQTWGFNVDRWIPSTNEDIFWRPVPRNVTAWSSRMGELTGIEGVRPSRRLELLPYAAANATVRSQADPANPFDPTGREASLRLGGDLKVGLGPNLTAEATVNPDFGQVEADPAVVNLSAFEVFFDERRPFFVEGSQLLRGNGPNFFYSRRIGAPPPGSAAGDFVDAPRATTILSATKITGRLAGGLSVGALAAITARERAHTWDSTTSAFGTTDVSPVTGYGVVRLQQEFGRNQSLVGATLTGVRRDLDPASGLASLLNRQAVTGGVDFNLRFANGWYTLGGYLGGSVIDGDSLAIARQQRSSRRYYQRPDQTYVRYDPSRTVLTGFAAGLYLSKNSGRHWLWNIQAGTESPGLEQNDAGRIVTADGHNLGGRLTWRETRPGRVFRAYSVGVNLAGEWNYGGVRQFGEARLDASGTFLNQWQLNGTLWVDGSSFDERLTRGGPLMQTPRSTVRILQFGSNFAAVTQWRVRTYYETSENGNNVYRLSGTLAFRPGPRWYLQATPNYLYSRDPRQYVTQAADAGATATYGVRYIFATIDQTQWGVQFRFNYAFQPDLTLEVYAEPFVASGAYARHGELPAPRRRDLRIYGEAAGTTATRDSSGAVQVTDGAVAFTLANRDFDVTSWRSNVVLRWEWRPGSTLFLVWQQNRGASTPTGQRARVDDLFRGLGADGDNFLAVKATWWFAPN
jgi:hypothetical protein